MRVGFAVPQSGAWATPENLRRVATRAEALGYHELWTFQRLLYPVGHQMGPTYRSVHDPLITLAHLSGVTSRIRLGVAVINAYVQPVVLAKQLATLQTLSGGRLTAGLGLGWVPEEFEATGVGMERRGRRGEEYVEVLRKAWADDVIEHHGEFYRVSPSHMDPKPEPGPPPILLGGAAEVALRRAARLADGWVSSSREDLSAIAGRVRLLKEAVAEAGRDADAFRIVVRGVTQVRAARSDRSLTGTYDDIRHDVAELAAAGVTEVFHDLNFDREFVTLDAKEAMRRAEEALEALAP
ncbi:TIGR03619 family F420-dependent LLM class oxidoreductase [Nonomuraea jiangxiensis]|uniref:Probable F420-dependent oxidoreductase, Rv2161c family n=1 Tax=Nonomuraea jiangxiensis TaxID=633440 RepID=A0A1G8WTN0_9ACTN|nr:TIGR03619 family F420-dependent LLM class oxidoreductase [Nonomuraea jiangxiensis]SDJ81406.1 probable F420-dependent oxidoreductase, Rv2161c family [Nonomuraea jiangxiensis]